MGFTRVSTGKPKKDAPPISEIAKLRSMIRKSIR
jgi:hypothetical protein